ncbi:MAG: histidine kinase [Pseudomonadota bacterium]
MRNKTERFLHDARGPLNTISVNAELAKLLAQKNGAGDNIVNALNIILSECQRCNQILYEFGAESSGDSME